jgi:hypothetical protein
MTRHASTNFKSLLLLHPAAQASAAIAEFAQRLAKVSAAMDMVIAAEGDNVRPAVEALAEKLIAFLDATAPDPDLEDDESDDNPDDEPSLGPPEVMNQARAWTLCGGNCDDYEIDLGSPECQRSQVFSHSTFGTRDEREEENEHHDGWGFYGCDDEPPPPRTVHKIPIV